jgi:RNA polymerase sigma-70 factor (ECF subfamily)
VLEVVACLASFARFAMPPPIDQSRWFAEEVQPHDALLRAVLRNKFPTLPDIEDLVQEAYTRLVRAHADGTVVCPRAFLFHTARNLALNQIRHRGYTHPDPLTEPNVSGVLDSGESVPELVARAEDIQLLIQAIQSLPERCRQVFTLRKIYGLSQKEIAARLGISENTVEVQGAIGIRKCAEYFQQHGDAPPIRP